MKDNPDLLSSNRVKIFVGDGRLGSPENGPYKAIHVGAASPKLPEELVKQLKVIYYYFLQLSSYSILNHLFIFFYKINNETC